MDTLFEPKLQACFSTLFTFDFSDTECLSLVISKTLSIGIFLGSLAVKLPQILKIFSAGSGEGVSISFHILESVGHAINVVYNLRRGNPVLTYGEAFTIFVQDCIILFLLFQFSKKSVYAVFTVGGLLGLAYSAYYFVDPSLLDSLQWSVTAIFAASKVPQILSNFKNGHTGQLSFLTWFLNVAGSSARVFTTMTEVKDDTAILYGHLTGFSLNVIILLQILFFWQATNKATSKEKKD
uniref:Mannose-P-dolichol utilization defect 1 protein homolog n=1 Tax=Palpitomonas bilix TaxID=652834 RepID=A0A7S3DKU7_9EUKA|mmetsp:Transcript_42503/g.109273  ORF Transcript_42503/g.109273 Transcript_42503/m.109273 type:complete len:238 (+) Transcript_42503:91-804(+)|eukprot:CAMPEP_0113867470 /NCGR_PEP_ID=MMETSP0780_2-20120614/436_1 /TAXON_ID=652834 /ORGANISM="Palpitomonas bilix" /LENGTH=237 /DNA_ID=CAMNT_0000852415 /DNA_START=91 /DNA_END=804 /DNA_ORIENTATION=- /assembly_acc=CAM_ASM_000599